MPCYTSNTNLDASRLDDGAATFYYVNVGSTSPIKLTFTPPSGESITSVACSPPGPSTGSDWVEFGTAHISNTYTVTVIYTGAARSNDDADFVRPMFTPTKTPKFRPVLTCP